MNLFQGEIREIFIKDGMRTGTVSINGVLKRASLALLPDVNVGDTILINAGVGISKIEKGKKEEKHVPRNSG